jgi:hypothetical protein
LFQSGGLSHVDLFDDKPTLHEFAGQEIPPSIKGSQRLTGMTSGQKAYPVLPPLKPGKRSGQGGLWISDLLPHLQTVADDLCIIKTVNTEAINHDPAITFMNTGNQLPGYASIGAWASYGLGSVNENLPAFVAMVSQGTGKNPGQPIFSRLWGSGFLPSSHQGVGLRPGANPVLYLNNPPGVDREQRRELLDPDQRSQAAPKVQGSQVRHESDELEARQFVPEQDHEALDTGTGDRHGTRAAEQGRNRTTKAVVFSEARGMHRRGEPDRYGHVRIHRRSQNEMEVEQARKTVSA